jgi:CheY-like chemotaxis protein
VQTLTDAYVTEMNSSQDNVPIRVLVADDDVHVLRCYQRAFANSPPSSGEATLALLSDQLFGTGIGNRPQQPVFDIVACSQGDVAVEKATAATEERQPFDAVILDIRMPPGINGLEAGKSIRRLDPEVPIVFVSGYSDVSKEELQRSVPPASRLHYFSKPLSFSDLARQVVEIVRDARSTAGS